MPNRPALVVTRHAPTLATRAAHDLASALRSSACYPHPAGRVERIETHISYVFLAGEHAYKIKKPLRLPFLDFSSLEARRRCCEEEVRLNRRTAPDLYLGVVPICGSRAAPRVGGRGRAIEYAVHMRRFPQPALLARLARAGKMRPEHVDSLAAAVAQLHAKAQRAPANSPYGTSARVLNDSLANFDDIEALEERDNSFPALGALREWTVRTHGALRPRLAQRHAEGFVRECHGDLHLANVVLLAGHAIPFDAIEFNPALRWIDVMSEVAFPWMDLEHHGLAPLAARFLDAYLQASGDYLGLETLRFYAIYRAMVRAKVACIRAHELALSDPGRSPAHAEIAAHLALARRLSRVPRPALILMHGLSGSGKSTLAQCLLETLGAIRLRSDVERKRRHALTAGARRGAAPGRGLYTVREDDLTYARLAALASPVLAAGYPVIVDATFLRRSRRDAFRALASAAGASFTIVACDAPMAALRERIGTRARSGTDASDAGLAVLEHQARSREPLGYDEVDHAIVVETTHLDAAHGACRQLVRRLHHERR